MMNLDGMEGGRPGQGERLRQPGRVGHRPRLRKSRLTSRKTQDRQRQNPGKSRPDPWKHGLLPWPANGILRFPGVSPQSLARKTPEKLRADFFRNGNLPGHCLRKGTPKDGRGTTAVGLRNGACASPFFQKGPEVFRIPRLYSSRPTFRDGEGTVNRGDFRKTKWPGRVESPPTIG